MRCLLAIVVLAGLAAAQEPMLRGIAFGPFRDREAPGVRAPLPSALRADVASASRVAKRLRTYGMAGTGFLVPELCADAQVRCWAGAWISGDRAADDLECELLVRAATRFPDTVEAVLVGNEALLRGDVDETTLWRRAANVRRSLRRADVETRVGIAEPWRVWLEHRELANGILDVVVVHVHPYWDGVDVADAPRYTLEKLDAVRAIVDESDTLVVLGEFGWPTAGDPNGAAVPGPDHAARYFGELLPQLEARGRPYFAFEMWDEAWKADAEGQVGSHWGLFSSDGTPKPELVAALPGLAPGASSRPPRRTDPDLREPGPGSDRLPAVTAKLIPIVEAATGLEFNTPPRIRVADGFEWDDLVRREIPDTEDPSWTVARTLGLFLPESGEVVLSPGVGGNLTYDDSLDAPEWRPALVDRAARGAWLTVVHELTHALQEQHFALGSRMRAESDRARRKLMKALVEGHALATEARLARELFGIDGYATRVVPRRYEAVGWEMQGLTFVQHVHDTQGEAGVRAALRDPLPTPAEFGRTLADAMRARRRSGRRPRRDAPRPRTRFAR